MIKHVGRALLLRGAVVGLIGLISGCEPPQAVITTNKDQDFTREPKRLVVINVMGEGGKYTDTYEANFARRIKGCGVTLDAIDRPPQTPNGNTPANSDRGAETQRIRQFGPDTILSVTERGYRTRPMAVRVADMTNVEITYALELTDRQSRKPVWKAQIVLNASFGDPGEALANAIVAKLTEDKILRSCGSAAS